MKIFAFTQYMNVIMYISLYCSHGLKPSQPSTIPLVTLNTWIGNHTFLFFVCCFFTEFLFPLVLAYLFAQVWS